MPLTTSAQRYHISKAINHHNHTTGFSNHLHNNHHYLFDSFIAVTMSLCSLSNLKIEKGFNTLAMIVVKLEHCYAILLCALDDNLVGQLTIMRQVLVIDDP